MKFIPVLTSFDMTAYPSDLTIVDANNLYSSNNVEDALQEIAGSPFTFKRVKKHLIIRLM